MKKLAIFLVLMVVVSGIMFADEFVAAKIVNAGANTTHSANQNFTFSSKDFSLARASSFEEAIASLCNYMDSKGYELVRIDLYPNSTAWIALFKKK